MHSIQINKKNIKNTYIRVNNEGTIVVNCPENTSQKYIDNLLIKRNDWIKQRLDELEKKRLIECENKDKILYLGNYYDQKEILSEDSKVLFEDNIFKFYLHRVPFDSLKEKILKKWKQNRLHEIVRKYLDIYISKTGLKPEFIEYKNMSSRWGYCQTYKKRIVFSYNLINMPESFIEYVVLHELCHLKVASHGRKFYKLLERYMVDYKEKKCKQ